jgi:hypothetical protein
MGPGEAFEASKERRQQEYEERRKKAEIELLGGAQNMQEYTERLKALRSAVVQPEIPLDEMSMSDYMKIRGRQSR